MPELLNHHKSVKPMIFQGFETSKEIVFFNKNLHLPATKVALSKVLTTG